MRKFLFALLFLLVIFFVITRFTEMQSMAAVVRQGKAQFILLAVILQFCWMGVVGYSYHYLYGMLGIQTRPLAMAHLTTAASFLSVIAPSAGLSSIALFFTDARAKGISAARVTVAAVLYIWLEYAATLFFLVFGLMELSRRDNLHWSEITASLVLFAAALIIMVILYLGTQSAELLGRVFSRVIRAGNAVTRFVLRREYLHEEPALKFAHDLAAGLSLLRKKPRRLLVPALLALLNKSILIMILGFCFFAFSLQVDLATIVAGFSITYVFVIVSPTPAGLGIADGVMAVALRSLAVPIESATVITLAYRGITFWFQLLVGLIALRTLRLRHKKANNP